MRNFFTLIIILFSIASSESSKFSVSIGMSETMGYHGGLNFNININDNFFFTAGTSLIFGGAGLGWRHSFNKYRLSPFISTAVFGTYTIPLMCENCQGLNYDSVITGSLGLDLIAIKTNNLSINLQTGFMSYIYSIGKTSTDNPISNPTRWPFLNIKMTIYW